MNAFAKNRLLMMRTKGLVGPAFQNISGRSIMSSAANFIGTPIPVPIPLNIFGAELISNGLFDADLSGWTNDSWVWSVDGAAVSPSGGGTVLSQDTGSLVIGTTYRVAITVSGVGTLRIYVGDDDFMEVITNSAVPTLFLLDIVKGNNIGNSVSLITNLNVGDSNKVWDISVKETL